MRQTGRRPTSTLSIFSNLSSPPSCRIVSFRKLTIPRFDVKAATHYVLVRISTYPKYDPEDKNGELMGGRQEDGDAGKEGQEEVHHVDPAQLEANMLTSFLQDR